MIVTAALGHVPPPLIEQLNVGGRLVMPLGPTRRSSSPQWPLCLSGRGFNHDEHSNDQRQGCSAATGQPGRLAPLSEANHSYD
jgi:protein-L-isoaspartate O-methyltransferase